MTLKSYDANMGQLIDLSDPYDFNNFHDPRALNIPYQRLLLHYKDLLDKNQSYYLICKKGLHSSKAAIMLEYLGYDVTQVIY